MRFLANLLSAALVFTGFAHAANWAVLIAGSNQWYNYRHQADVAHAYQLLRTKGGYPAANIVTMMYDDIANNPSNPKKGQLFNKPNGPDVYQGINIDYKGDTVTATNFLNVLGGNKAAMANVGTGKVVESTAQDNVFVYYSDHGAFGFIGMPTGGYLYAHDLNATLSTMAEQKKFNKLVFYLEACESGSMFNNVLPGNENVWAITAANPDESSYAFYYDSTIGTYLGDEFSVHFLEDSEAEALDQTAFNLEKQFEVVQGLVKQSHVMKYGEADMSALPVGEFLLYDKLHAPLAGVQFVQNSISNDQNGTDVRQVEVEILKRKIAEAKTDRERLDYEALLAQELSSRDKMDDTFANLVATVTQSAQEEVDHPFDGPRDFVCLKNSVEEFEAKCGSLQGYGFKYGRTVAALCDLGYGFDAIKAGIAKVCAPSTIVLQNY
jgi:legumain